jgi:hypothetical protein
MYIFYCFLFAICYALKIFITFGIEFSLWAFQIKKMRLILFLSACFCFQFAFSQNSFYVKGKVLDDSSGLPLEGASVICENTTRGTFTDTEGSFGLQLPMGGHNLAISFSGYDKKEIRISNAEDVAEDRIIRLKKKTKQLEEVVVQASNEVADGWQQYGKEFASYFIGNSSNAAACNLANPEVLKFFYSKKKNRLKVKIQADEPIVVMNYALGYKIRYMLDSFILDYANKKSSYSGAAFYQELDSTEAQRNIWKINREKTYYGSRLHFMRCYYDSTLAENDYTITEVEVDSSNAPINKLLIENPYDPSFYTVLNENEKEILLIGKYLIEYKGKEPMERAYLKANQYPVSAKEQLSTIQLLDGFIMSENGFFYNNKNVINSGYWAWKNLADQLPYDYWPEGAVSE